MTPPRRPDVLRVTCALCRRLHAPSHPDRSHAICPACATAAGQAGHRGASGGPGPR